MFFLGKLEASLEKGSLLEIENIHLPFSNSSCATVVQCGYLVRGALPPTWAVPALPHPQAPPPFTVALRQNPVLFAHLLWLSPGEVSLLEDIT